MAQHGTAQCLPALPDTQLTSQYHTHLLLITYPTQSNYILPMCGTLLLMFLSPGPGNWAAVAEHVGTKTTQECLQHYYQIYIEPASFPLPTPAPEMAGVGGTAAAVVGEGWLGVGLGSNLILLREGGGILHKLCTEQRYLQMGNALRLYKQATSMAYIARMVPLSWPCERPRNCSPLHTCFASTGALDMLRSPFTFAYPCLPCCCIHTPSCLHSLT
jgi:hypothetical protein